jgi:mannose-6-phosphate isomerase-like protein (cupin superfamily)
MSNVKRQMYNISVLTSAPRVPFRFDGRILFTSPGYELVHLTLHPGEQMEMHVQPFDVVFFVTSGKGVLKVGTETVEVDENTMVSVNKGVDRAWSNPGSRDLIILVNKLMEVKLLLDHQE